MKNRRFLFLLVLVLISIAGIARTRDTKNYNVTALSYPNVEISTSTNDDKSFRFVVVSNITLELMNKTILKKDMTRWQNDYSSYGQSKYLRLKPDAISQFRSVFVKVFDGYFTKEDSRKLDSLKKIGDGRGYMLNVSMVIDDQGGIDQLKFFYSYNPKIFADIDHKKLLELVEGLAPLKLVYHLPNDCLKLFATFIIDLTALRDNRLVPDSRNTKISSF